MGNPEDVQGKWRGRAQPSHTCFQGGKQDAVSLRKVRVQVSGGVACTGDAGDLLDATTTQLVQHQTSIPLCWHLLLIGLDAAHKVKLRPAQGHQLGCRLMN